MSIRAGSIIHVGGRNVIDRLQSAGLGDARIPIETVREIGNDLVVDKIPGEADFTFGLESWDVSTELMAWLTGKVGNAAGTVEPGGADPAGTAYKWEDCKYVHITSPWKRNPGSSGGNISAGVVVPNYYPTRLRYRFGVTDNAVQEVELAGGAYFYAETAPAEEHSTGDGAITAFVTAESARAHRVGGSTGTTFRRVLGVIVDGVLQVEGVDYTQSIAAADTGQPAVTTVTFTTAPANGVDINIVYFTETAKTYPQSVHPSTIVKPGAVRGRNIEVLLGTRGAGQARLPGLQSFELEATTEGEVEREMGNSEIIGRSVTGTDTTGTANFRPKDIGAFFAALNQVTGVDRDEVFGYLNQTATPVEVRIYDPRNPATVIKTIYVEDGLFQPPGTPARAGAATEFSMRFDSQRGTFAEFKGLPSDAQIAALY